MKSSGTSDRNGTPPTSATSFCSSGPVRSVKPRRPDSSVLTRSVGSTAARFLGGGGKADEAGQHQDRRRDARTLMRAPGSCSPAQEPAERVEPLDLAPRGVPAGPAGVGGLDAREAGAGPRTAHRPRGCRPGPPAPRNSTHFETRPRWSTLKKARPAWQPGTPPSERLRRGGPGRKRWCGGSSGAPSGRAGRPEGLRSPAAPPGPLADPSAGAGIRARRVTVAPWSAASWSRAGRPARSPAPSRAFTFTCCDVRACARARAACSASSARACAPGRPAASSWRAASA